MKLRALVVDDSRIMRNMVMNTLRQTQLADFVFTEAADGGDAMSKFDPKLIDIVFLDWNMPNLNGIEFARHARSLRWARHIPVVMITSESATGRQEKAYEEARITCYITKPFTPDTMRYKLVPVIAALVKTLDEATNQPESKSSGGFFSKLVRGE
jgi:two-component system chemotaxis response regulator CheY